MRITKKLAAIFLLPTLLALLGLSAFASSKPEAVLAPSDAGDDEISLTAETESYTQVNPLYEGIALPLEEFSPPLDGGSTVSVPVDSDYCQSVEEAAVAVRDGMENRQETVVTTLESATAVSHKDIFAKAIEHTGVPTQGDYLRLNYYGYSVHIRTITYKNTYYYTYTFTFTYLDSAQEEAAVTAAVEALITSLQPADNSRYALLCAVYDAVTKTISYDYEHEDDYLSKYSTYSAAVTHLTVCQGYSSYMYRLLLTLGIPCRSIVGTSPGGAHAWNIVEIDDLYYDLDATWDAGRSSYSYFLKGEDVFAKDHTRDDAYATDEFMTAYPMSSVDYDHTFVESSRTEATCTEPGKILYICTDCGKEKEETIAALGHAYGDWTLETAATCTDPGTEQRLCANDASHIETRTIDALGHDYDDGVVTKEPTCKENGIMTYTCKNDSSHTYTEEISNEGIAHTYGEWVVDTPAACETPGVESRTCTVCGDTETEEIPALGHAYGDWTVATAATCEDPGTEQRLCANDASHIETRTIDALGHDYDDGVVTAEATATAPGVKTYTCTRCSTSYTETIPPLTPTLALGDVNGDGEVDFQDVTELFQYVNKQISSLEQEEASDVNQDGVIDLKDVTKLFQYVNGQISAL
jgi:hypothetical protein